jgi:predicted Ser/Thr protein kinase
MGPQTSTDILQPGQLIGGCEIEAFIAAGGMGAVYRARKSLLGRTVAVKVLYSHLCADPVLLKRFLREAQLAASFDHPSIVKVYDVGEEKGRHFIVMEYVEGRDLRDILNKDGPLPAAKAVRIARQVAEALAYAHERGVVHRDIKPANIIHTSSGTVKVADLGLARPIEEETQVTASGQLLGTPAFMSPEQCRGEAVDGRSDLYSLGATLYMLLCGKPPFQADSAAAVIHRVINERPPSLDDLVPGVPEKVVALIKRLMAKAPVARYQTGREVVQAIDQMLIGRFNFSGDPAKAPAAPAAPALPWGRLAALLLAGSLLGAGLYYVVPQIEAWASPRERQRAPGAQSNGDAGEAEEDAPPERQRGANLQDGEEGESDAGEEAPAPKCLESRSTRDPALEKRVRGLRDSLVTGDSEEILEYFEPSVRANRGLHLSLAAVLAGLKSRGLKPGSYFSHQQGPEKASSVILFSAQDGRRPVGFPVEWVRVKGEWYVKPQAAGLKTEN